MGEALMSDQDAGHCFEATNHLNDREDSGGNACVIPGVGCTVPS